MRRSRTRNLLLVLIAGALAFVAYQVWSLPAVQMRLLSHAGLPDLERRVRATPDEWRVQYWYGRRAAEVGRLAEAEEALRYAFGGAPDFLPAATELGKVLLAQGRVEEAFQILRMVVGRNPGELDAQLALAQLYRSQQSYARALEILEELVRKRPEDVTAWYELAAAQAGLQKYEAAEGSLRAGLKKDPRNTLLLTALSRVRRQRGDVAEAETYARQALAQRPDDPIARLELARALSEKKPPQAYRQEALAVLKEAQILSPEHPDILLEAGRLLLAEGRLQDSVAALRAATRLEPEAPDGYYLLSQALRRLGQEAESQRAEARFQRLRAYQARLEDLNARLSARPESPELRYQLGELHAAEGHLEEAITFYQNGLQRDPENQKARRRLQELVGGRQGSGAGAPSP